MSAPRVRTKAATQAISRRRFVSLLAAGSAAVIARPADAAAPPRRTRPAARTGAAAPAPVAAVSAEQKEFERQRANTLSTVKALREFKLPPGGDLPVVFRPLPSPRRGR